MSTTTQQQTFDDDLTRWERHHPGTRHYGNVLDDGRVMVHSTMTCSGMAGGNIMPAAVVDALWEHGQASAGLTGVRRIGWCEHCTIRHT